MGLVIEKIANRNFAMSYYMPHHKFLTHFNQSAYIVFISPHMIARPVPQLKPMAHAVKALLHPPGGYLVFEILLEGLIREGGLFQIFPSEGNLIKMGS